MRKFASFAAAAFLLLAHCSPPAVATICWLKPSVDFHERMPLILRENGEDFVYPSKCGAKTLQLTYQDKVRAVCPADTINVLLSDTKLAEAQLSCYGITLFGLSGTSYAAPFRQIRCNRVPQAVEESTSKNCVNGTISRLGFAVSNTSFAPIIEELCVNGGKTLWAHHKVVPGSPTKAKGGRKPALGGNLLGGWEGLGGLELPALPAFEGLGGFGRLPLFRPTTTARSTTPAGATGNQIVNATLVPSDDLFYRAQKDGAASSSLNSVPMYASVRDGNWRLVEDIVRKIASTKRKCATLDVWTGSYNGTYAGAAATTVAPSTTTSTTAAPTSSTSTTTPTSTTTSTTTAPTSTTSTTTPTSTTTSTTAAPTSSTTQAAANATAADPGKARSKRQAQPSAVDFPSRFLYKMVVDKTRGRGIVFVTLDDPTATVITADDQLCANTYAQCNSLYPQFNIATRGYTHCCTLEEFERVALDIGLPTFTNSQPLI